MVITPPTGHYDNVFWRNGHLAGLESPVCHITPNPD